jgi:antitoxin (DNA-binding transcriptional repressor) of toxin-antitoxin stability system
MKTASVREIRLRFPAVLKAVKDGETVAITSRRKIVATLATKSRVFLTFDARQRVFAQAAGLRVLP